MIESVLSHTPLLARLACMLSSQKLRAHHRNCPRIALKLLAESAYTSTQCAAPTASNKHNYTTQVHLGSSFSLMKPAGPTVLLTALK